MKRLATITGDRGYTVRVCYDLEAEAWDEALRQEGAAVERARIAAGIRGLPGECHDGEGLGCESSPCVENVSRAAVLAIVEGETTDGK